MLIISECFFFTAAVYTDLQISNDQYLFTAQTSLSYQLVMIRKPNLIVC